MEEKKKRKEREMKGNGWEFETKGAVIGYGKEEE